jgi:hypothetical protein
MYSRQLKCRPCQAQKYSEEERQWWAARVVFKVNFSENRGVAGWSVDFIRTLNLD